MENKDYYLGFYKEPLMKSPNFGYLGVRIQNKERSMIMCNECGMFLKRLHTKHLAKHGLTMQEYRDKYGYKKTTAMCADQESINLSKKILGKSHSINNNKEALEKRKDNHIIAMKEGKSSWKNSNERQNQYGTCIDQVGDRLKTYLDRFGRPPSYNAMGEDGKALFSLLKYRYGTANAGFEFYGLPIKKIIPGECVEYTFSDGTTIKVGYKHDNWDELYKKIKKTCNLYTQGIKNDSKTFKSTQRL